MQPFRDDADALRARASELEEELASMRERLIKLREPSQLRVEQLEAELASERRLLESVRRQPAAMMMWSNHGMIVPFFILTLVGFLLMRHC